MFKNKLCEDSPIQKIIHLKIRRQDGVRSLTTLEKGEFKVPIDGRILRFVSLMYPFDKKNHTFSNTSIYLSIFSPCSKGCWLHEQNQPIYSYQHSYKPQGKCCQQWYHLPISSKHVSALKTLHFWPRLIRYRGMQEIEAIVWKCLLLIAN